MSQSLSRGAMLAASIARDRYVDEYVPGEDVHPYTRRKRLERWPDSVILLCGSCPMDLGPTDLDELVLKPKDRAFSGPGCAVGWWACHPKPIKSKPAGVRLRRRHPSVYRAVFPPMPERKGPEEPPRLEYWEPQTQEWRCRCGKRWVKDSKDVTAAFLRAHGEGRRKVTAGVDL